MWHPFDLITEELELALELRTAQPAVNRSLWFEERALTYFHDKSSKTEQWPVNMDELPGLKITRRVNAETELEINHTWKLDYVRNLSGNMKCSGTWHSPHYWSFRRIFKPMFSRAARFDPVEVEGRWQGGKLEQTYTGSAHQQVQTETAERLLSIYALMAGFPLEAGEPGSPTKLLGEDLVVTGSARMLRSTEALQHHHLAKSLTGFLLDAQGNFPTEFWVNEHGLVVYVFNGVSKAFILTRVEDTA
ncbi:hypothetical protein [Bythopirellula polymerisocia]|uniref:Uncharacterized protein n=1 Tax=Bythopirellula polymerisocia TaxID=2528003 RepID=A0A5C6CC26_9BACT|nr:hypothetical protein [Bythopirellula polymerisocia]TWU21798.1 hypothetical protein Pla144_44940 [Bythopirellula polymerisocia]